MPPAHAVLPEGRCRKEDKIIKQRHFYLLASQKYKTISRAYVIVEEWWKWVSRFSLSCASGLSRIPNLCRVYRADKHHQQLAAHCI